MSNTSAPADATGLPTFAPVQVLEHFDKEWEAKFLAIARLAAALVSKSPCELKAALAEANEEAWLEFLSSLSWLTTNAGAIAAIAKAAEARIFLVAECAETSA